MDTTKFAGLRPEQAAGLSDDELRSINDQQFGSASPELQLALRERVKNGQTIVQEAQKDLDAAGGGAEEGLGQALRGPSEGEGDKDVTTPLGEGGKDVTPPPGEGGKDVTPPPGESDPLKGIDIPKLTMDQATNLTDEQLLKLNDQQINSIEDKKVSDKIKERRRIALENEAEKKGEDAGLDFFKKPEKGQGGDRASEVVPPKVNQEEETPVKMAIDFNDLTSNIVNHLDGLPAPIASAVNEISAIWKQKLVDQNSLDQKLQIENQAALAVEQRKKLQKDVLNILRFVRWAALGAGIGYLISLNPGAVGWAFGIGAGSFAAGSLYEGVFSLEGKQLALDRAKLDRIITERKGYTTKLRDKALRREITAVSAFSTLAAEVYAQTSGITDEAQRKKFIAGFTGSLGMPTLNAIINLGSK